HVLQLAMLDPVLALEGNLTAIGPAGAGVLGLAQTVIVEHAGNGRPPIVNQRPARGPVQKRTHTYINRLTAWCPFFTEIDAAEIGVSLQGAQLPEEAVLDAELHRSVPQLHDALGSVHETFITG